MGGEVASRWDAMARHGKPDIFNTDQGSQFTGSTFTERTDKGAGGNATAFCVAIADAGFEICDTIMWVHGAASQKGA